MELPVGQIALDLIKELEAVIANKQEEIKAYQGAIEGVKLMVGKLQTHAEANQPAVEVSSGATT